MQAQESVIQANLDLRNEKDYPKDRGKLRKTRILFDLALQVMTNISIRGLLGTWMPKIWC